MNGFCFKTKPLKAWGGKDGSEVRMELGRLTRKLLE